MNSYTKAPEQTYTIRVKCGNCEPWSFVGHEIEIPFGTEVKEHPCPNCGCYRLRPA